MGDKAQKPKRQTGENSQAFSGPQRAASQPTTARYAARTTEDTLSAEPESAVTEDNRSVSPESGAASGAERVAPPAAGGHSLSRFAILPGGQVPAATSRVRAQARMDVSQPGEPAEVEAEAMADSVMRMPSPTALTPTSSTSSGPMRLPRLHASSAPVARAPASSAAEQMGVNGDVDRDGADAAPAVNQALSGGGGQALDSGAQEFLGERMGQDFSHVRVHADETAARSADAVNAQAYTVGNNVVFGRGQYQPGSSAGKKLLAHELTHVVQQTGGAARKPKGAVNRLRQNDRLDPLTDAPQTTPDANGTLSEPPQSDPPRRQRGRRNATTPVGDNPAASPSPSENRQTASTTRTANGQETFTADQKPEPSTSQNNASTSTTGTGNQNPAVASASSRQDAEPKTKADSDTPPKENDPATVNGKAAEDKTDKTDKNSPKNDEKNQDKAAVPGSESKGDTAKEAPGGGLSDQANVGAGNLGGNGMPPVAGSLAGQNGGGPAGGETARTETAPVDANADVPDRQPGTVIAADDDAAATFPPETRLGRTANGFTLFETDAPTTATGGGTGAVGSDTTLATMPTNLAAPPTATLGGTGTAGGTSTTAGATGGTTAVSLARKANPSREGSENAPGNTPQRGRSFPVPSSTATQMVGHQRERIQQALSEFLAFGQERAARINALSDGIAPRVQAATQQAHATIDSSLQRGLDSVSGAIGKARETAVSRAETARQAVRTQHTQLVSDMAAATVAAKQSADQEYTTGVATLDPLLQQNVQALNPLYEQSARSLREKANQSAAKAQPLAAAKAGEYNGQTPEHSKGLFGLGAALDNLDWDTYVSNWRRAKVTAAQDKATEFEQKLREDAEKVVTGQSGARGQIVAGFTEQTTKARTDMGTIRSASGGAFDTLQQEKTQAAQQTLQSQLSSIDDQLQATLGELSNLESTKQGQLRDQAAQQKTAVTQAGAAATTALQTQISEAASGVSAQVNQVAASVRQMRQAGAARGALEDAKQSIDGDATQAQTGITQAIDGIGSKLSAQGEAASQQVDQTAQTAQSEADQQAQSFSSQMDQAASAAGQEFNGLRQQHQQAVQAATTRLKETYKARADQLKQGFTTALERQRQEFTKTETEFTSRAEQSFADLPATMEAAATEAASKVQPGWKFWAKIIVMVAVAIVCAIVVTALVATGVGIILAGVIVGAAAGLVTQALNDIIDGKVSSLTDYIVAGASGAIGGLIGGGAGVLGKALTTQGGAVVSAFSRPALQSAARFATTLGLDTAGNVAGGFVDFGLRSASAMFQGSAPPDFNLREIVGMGLFGAALGKGIGSGMERSGLTNAINNRFSRPGSTGGTGGTNDSDTATPTSSDADLPPVPLPEPAPISQGDQTTATNVGGDTPPPATAVPESVPPAVTDAPTTRTTETGSTDTRTSGDTNTPLTEGALLATETALPLAEPTVKPADATPQDARTRYQTERQAVRQADYEQFRQNKIAELRGDPRTANLSDVEIETAVRTARRQGQLSPADQYRMRYHMDAPTGRAAEIDARTGANYQRLIEQRIASQDNQYRYTTDRVKGFYENDGKISRPTYMTDEQVTSNSESMSRAQVAQDWGLHTTGIEIPRGAIRDVRVPRPFGDSPHVKRGWEPFTNSYPEYGRGGALQYKATTDSYDPNWAYPLENNYGKPVASASTTTDAVVATGSTPRPTTASVTADGRDSGTTRMVTSGDVPPPTTDVPGPKNPAGDALPLTPDENQPIVQEQEQLQQQSRDTDQTVNEEDGNSTPSDPTAVPDDGFAQFATKNNLPADAADLLRTSGVDVSHAEQLIAKGIPVDQVVSIARGGTKAVDTASGLVDSGLTPEQARVIARRSIELGLVDDVHTLVQSGKLGNPQKLQSFLNDIKKGNAGFRQALSDATDRARNGNTVEVENGQADVVDQTQQEAIQHKQVSGKSRTALFDNLKEAAKQLRGEKGEVPPPGYDKVADVRLTNPDNPYYNAGREEVLDVLRNTPDIHGPTRFKITTGTGTYEFTQDDLQ